MRRCRVRYKTTRAFHVQVRIACQTQNRIRVEAWRPKGLGVECTGCKTCWSVKPRGKTGVPAATAALPLDLGAKQASVVAPARVCHRRPRHAPLTCAGRPAHRMHAAVPRAGSTARTHSPRELHVHLLFLARVFLRRTWGWPQVAPAPLQERRLERGCRQGGGMRGPRVARERKRGSVSALRGSALAPTGCRAVGGCAVGKGARARAGV